MIRFSFWFVTFWSWLFHINEATKSRRLQVSPSKFNSNLVFLCVLVPLWPCLSIAVTLKQQMISVYDSERIDPQHRIIGARLVLLIKLIRGIDDPGSVDDKFIGIFSGLEIDW